MKPVPFKAGDAVAFLWEDSNFLPGWQDKGTRGATLHVDSIGYVTDCDDEQITITSSLTEEKAIMCPITVPWSSVITIDKVNL